MRRLIRLVPCPFCTAKAGEACYRGGIEHKARVELARTEGLLPEEHPAPPRPLRMIPRAQKRSRYKGNPPPGSY